MRRRTSRRKRATRGYKKSYSKRGKSRRRISTYKPSRGGIRL